MDVKFVSTASRRFITEVCLRMVFGLFNERSFCTTASFGRSYCNERHCNQTASYRRAQRHILSLDTFGPAACSRLENIQRQNERRI